MLKKIFALLLCFFCFSIRSYGKDRYIFFLEDYQYEDLYQYKDIKRILDNSVKGLAIQRSGGCEFSYFYSISKKRPSNISINEIPLYNGNERLNNISIVGFVEKDGTFYVPSKFLVYGQTFMENKGQNNEKIFIEHVQDVQRLDKKLEAINTNKEIEIIISSWSRNHNKNYENYIMPFIYYNNKNKGIFYSNSTRNQGILDYENISSILSGNITKLEIIDGDINRIYKNRVQSLKSKRTFLTKYGYFIGILTILNSLLLIFRTKRIAAYSSLFAIITPFIILIEPQLFINSLNLKIIAIIILSLILSITLKRSHLRKFSIVFLTVIYIDAVFYRFLLSNSLLSYEPALGARFYGIGNEFLGVIIAYILIFISESKSKKNWRIWFINAGLLLYDGSGNNFGGFLTCGFIGFYLSPLGMKVFEIIAAILMIFLSNNHIGRFFKNLVNLNIGYVTDTMLSKLYTFKRLLQVNIWTELIVISILIYIYNLLKGILKFNGNTLIFVISCILVVLFNDSGIVSCALIMMVYLNYIFYTISVEEKDGIY